MQSLLCCFGYFRIKLVRKFLQYKVFILLVEPFDIQWPEQPYSRTLQKLILTIDFKAEESWLTVLLEGSRKSLVAATKNGFAWVSAHFQFSRRRRSPDSVISRRPGKVCSLNKWSWIDNRGIEDLVGFYSASILLVKGHTIPLKVEWRGQYISK